ncbi:hypothetical protein PS3A_37700 [Pseudomonas sp. 3A(2025)]
MTITEGTMSIETYRKYRRILKTTPFHGKFMEYKWGGLPSSIDAQWMPYSQMFEEFSRELVWRLINNVSHASDAMASRARLIFARICSPSAFHT